MTANNRSEENEIEWNNIFVLDEFVKYLDIKSLAEFSLVSKFNRNKLNSRIFAHSAFIREDYFRYFKKNLSEYEDQLYFSYFDFIDSIWDLNLLNVELRVQLIYISERLDLMNQLIDGSRGIEPFIKSLRVTELGHMLYILYPIAFSFSNLIQLEIDSCTFPLLALLKIGENLKKLKNLTLNKVLLIEFEKQELSSSFVYFPSSLEELTLNYFAIVTLNPKPTDIYIVGNQNHKECSESNYFDQSKSSNLKKLHLAIIKSDYVRKLLNIYQNVEEFTINDCDLDQRIIDKLSAMQNLTKLSIHNHDSESIAITSLSGLIFPQFNFITNLALEFSECMYKANNEFLHFTNYFPNLTQLSIDLSTINFENINIGKFFLETLPSYQKLEILTLVYMDLKEEYNFNWLKFISVDCLILDFDYVDSDEIDFRLFSYKIKEVRKRTLDIKFELECIEDNPEIFDKWTISYCGNYIYFEK
ncbi:hypothetical protein CONCODRAFT_12945 [Conidiobolus coronatus NRRL 28638]|uniref:F-box domain-containing protein n=1 Tax=Conidiobolus coronatus (strain ATCC 28846 / CBS 209.66 / NRRL 28638) TaxID=796925 RepID=A0A137NRR0_CONC2|nr:hypothetical protein CONCODRAFT_12945 [Conidiobolus coronatus NRRL 28638]|eukprot:KXN65456.1 hypothetical protein CONCODRAFT_12945 [Conidiobolus coronatus NRRL 28638]